MAKIKRVGVCRVFRGQRSSRGRIFKVCPIGLKLGDGKPEYESSVEKIKRLCFSWVVRGQRSSKGRIFKVCPIGLKLGDGKPEYESSVEKIKRLCFSWVVRGQRSSKGRIFKVCPIGLYACILQTTKPENRQTPGDRPNPRTDKPRVTA